MPYIDVVVEDDNGNTQTAFAHVEKVSSKNGPYLIRYMSPTDVPNVYNFETTTYTIDRECIDYFYTADDTLPYSKTENGWTLVMSEDTSESEYEPSDTEESESESESLEDEDDENKN